jgi:hypothetical protein
MGNILLKMRLHARRISDALGGGCVQELVCPIERLSK